MHPARLAAVTLIVVALAPPGCRGARTRDSGWPPAVPTFVYPESHETNRWRAAAHRPPPSMAKALLWRRDAIVGIGNALGSVVYSTQHALAADQVVLMQSRILSKFCDLVRCAIEPLPGFTEASVRNLTKLLEHSGHLGNMLRPFGKATEVPAVVDRLSSAMGCEAPSKSWRAQHGSWQVERPWVFQCMYSRVLRSLFAGGSGEAMAKEASWLQSFYASTGSRSATDTKFLSVMEVDKRAPPAYDVVIHLRTLELIEDWHTPDLKADHPLEKASVFVNSTGFESMVRCLAHAITLDDRLTGPATAGRQASVGAALSVFLATDGAMIREELASRLSAALARALKAEGKRRTAEVRSLVGTRTIRGLVGSHRPVCAPQLCQELPSSSVLAPPQLCQCCPLSRSRPAICSSHTRSRAPFLALRLDRRLAARCTTSARTCLRRCGTSGSAKRMS